MQNRLFNIWMVARFLSFVGRGILYQYSKIAYLQVDRRCYYARNGFTWIEILQTINAIRLQWVVGIASTVPSRFHDFTGVSRARSIRPPRCSAYAIIEPL